MSWSDTDIPLKFESAEELEAKIKSYFDSCFAPVMEDIRNPEYDEDEAQQAKTDGEKYGIPKYIRVQKTDAKGTLIWENIRPLTISGLAVELGTSRRVLLSYQKEEHSSLDEATSARCSNAIKEAKNKIENFLEEYMYNGKNQTSGIFVAKNNFNWIDQTEQKTTLDLVDPKKVKDKVSGMLDD